MVLAEREIVRELQKERKLFKEPFGEKSRLEAKQIFALGGRLSGKDQFESHFPHFLIVSLLYSLMISGPYLLFVYGHI